MGTGDAPMMAFRMAGMSPPVERSMTVSAPYLTEERSFSSSSSIFEVTAELPMLELILHLEATPMHMGSRFWWFTFAGMIIRPRATSERTNSGAMFSRRATYSISSVITPLRA
jgi:hypothetical protein